MAILRKIAYAVIVKYVGKFVHYIEQLYVIIEIIIENR